MNILLFLGLFVQVIFQFLEKNDYVFNDDGYEDFFRK